MFKKFKKYLNFNKLSTLIFYLSILTFIIAFNFSDNPAGGWYQQFMPNLNGAFITDITFTDSLTGYAVTNKNSSNISYILKTTNSGDNWNIIKNDVREFTKVQFLNNDTGYTGTYFGTSTARAVLFKTTNGGVSWDSINRPNDDFEYQDFCVLNPDTIWATYYGVFGGGIYRTTNGGQSWTNQYYVLGNNPDKVYFYNGNIGFMYNQNDSLFKTTNSGLNWFMIPGGAFTDIYFMDSITGWKANGDMKKTTDGGLNWNMQYPIGGITSFDIINNNLSWGTGGAIFFPGFGYKGIVSKSTDDGITWGYQFPDTTFRIPFYFKLQFKDELVGWSYASPSIKGGVYTVSGGNDTTIYVGINELNNSIPEKFNLFQNYPNPFNPSTIISYEIKVRDNVSIKVFNILGMEIKTLVDKIHNSGKYKIEFNASNLASGIYYYSLIIDGKISDTKKMILLR